MATRYPVKPFNGTATLELELEAGEYIVYVKYDQWRTLNPEKDYEKWVMEKRTYPDVAKDVSSILPCLVSTGSLMRFFAAGFLPNGLQNLD